MAYKPPRHQPAQKYLYDQRWSVPRAAEAIGVTPNQLGAMLIGRIVPSPTVRERLPILLGGVPLEKLFDADLLAREYAGPRPWKNRKKTASSRKADAA